MNIQTYIFFDGNCAEAMRFYEKTLRGKLEMLMPYSEMPAMPGMAECTTPSSPDMAKRIAHACLMVGDQMLMASDNGPGMPYEGMKGFSVTLTYPEVTEAERVFNALAEGGQITMPLGETFWVERFGMLKDRFGTPWFINGGKAKA